MTELKPCPFCGGEAKVEWLCNAEPYFSTFQTVCTDCGIYIEVGSEEEAIKRWNTRPNPWHTGTPKEEGWYLLVCGIGNSSETYYTTDYWSNKVKGWCINRVLAWQKITPYVEANPSEEKK